MHIRTWPCILNLKEIKLVHGVQNIYLWILSNLFTLFLLSFLCNNYFIMFLFKQHKNTFLWIILFQICASVRYSSYIVYNPMKFYVCCTLIHVILLQLATITTSNSVGNHVLSVGWKQSGLVNYDRKQSSHT